ncbi:MAG: TAXI family TRAP transporter solute-binding subunit, partial [Pseudarthrobacter sp.]
MTDSTEDFTRRTALKAGLGVGLAGLLLPALSGCTADDRQDTVTVAGGEPGGFYLEFATLLADALQRHGVARRATAMTTGGSLDNLESLLSGKATFAVALSDSAALRAASGDAAAVGITAVGKVYENYVHCVVRQDSGIRDIAGLAGRTVAVGEPGSGTSLTTPRLLEAAGLGSTTAGNRPTAALDGTVTVLNLGLNEGVAALQDGSVDALFWSGGVPTAAIAAAHIATGLRLLDLSALLPALRAKYGMFYDRVLIPVRAYPGIPA